MAYKVPKISPSALAATEHCPRFKPSGAETQAGIDGTLMHEFAEQMVEVPRDQWAGWIATRETSPEMKGMLEEIAETLKTVILEDLPVVKDYRLRMRGGKPRKTLLKPGLYPELELERGQGRHGYIDLLVISGEGVATIVDHKSNRAEKDFSLQLKAYACDVHRLAPAHEMFECCIIAPRLDDEAQLRMRLGLEEIAAAEKEIAAIEERADRSANDDSIPGCPSSACEYCHWNGCCKYQANAAGAVLATNTADIVTYTEKTGKESVTQSLATLVGPGGPYEGETVTAQTFTAPATVAQRGLRRACLKFLEKLVEACKDDDTTWAEQYNDEQLKELVPGFSIARVRGRSSVDTTRMAEIRGAVMGKFGMSIEDVFECSMVDKKLLAESLVTVNGWTKKKAEDEVKRVFETFSTPGAPSVRWTQKPPKRAIEAEFE
jgi:hypothetical protein